MRAGFCPWSMSPLMSTRPYLRVCLSTRCCQTRSSMLFRVDVPALSEFTLPLTLQACVSFRCPMTGSGLPRYN